MAQYVKSTNFTAKDTLVSGDPLKKVKGTEIDVEFNAIATAIGSKADTESPTFTGTPAAPTATPGTNNTQLATTAFVVTALQALYPVGSVYINASVSTNPATLLGFGTWTEVGAGRVLVGQDTGDTSFDVLGETGGFKDASVVAHTHTGTTAANGGHSHTFPLTSNSGSGVGGWSGGAVLSNAPTSTVSDHTHSFTTDSTGSSGTNANLQPYVVVKMWKRIT